MSVPHWLEKKRPGRRVEGLAACLLPFEADGKMAETAFRESVQRTGEAGLGCAGNMDTGYANYIEAHERTEVLRWTTETLGRGFRPSNRTSTTRLLRYLPTEVWRPAHPLVQP